MWAPTFRRNILPPSSEYEWKGVAFEWPKCVQNESDWLLHTQFCIALCVDLRPLQKARSWTLVHPSCTADSLLVLQGRTILCTPPPPNPLQQADYCSLRTQHEWWRSSCDPKWHDSLIVLFFHNFTRTLSLASCARTPPQLQCKNILLNVVWIRLFSKLLASPCVI
jgi:hypothetical protein